MQRQTLRSHVLAELTLRCVLRKVSLKDKYRPDKIRQKRALEA